MSEMQSERLTFIGTDQDSNPGRPYDATHCYPLWHCDCHVARDVVIYNIYGRYASRVGCSSETLMSTRIILYATVLLTDTWLIFCSTYSLGALDIAKLLLGEGSGMHLQTEKSNCVIIGGIFSN